MSLIVPVLSKIETALKIIIGAVLTILAMMTAWHIAREIVAASNLTGKEAVDGATEIFKAVASFLTPLGAALVAWIGWKNYQATVEKNEQEKTKHENDVRIAETRRLDELFVRGLELFNDEQLHNKNIGFSLLEKIGMESKYYSQTVAKLFCDHIQKECQLYNIEYIEVTGGLSKYPSTSGLSKYPSTSGLSKYPLTGINQINMFKSLLKIIEEHDIYEKFHFNNITLSGIFLKSININNISFSYCLFYNSHFVNLNFSESDFYFCTIEESHFRGIKFDNTQIVLSKKISKSIFSKIGNNTEDGLKLYKHLAENNEGFRVCPKTL